MTRRAHPKGRHGRYSQITGHEVQVGRTETGGVEFDENLIGPRGGNGDGLDLDLKIGAFIDDHSSLAVRGDSRSCGGGGRELGYGIHDHFGE